MRQKFKLKILLIGIVIIFTYFLSQILLPIIIALPFITFIDQTINYLNLLMLATAISSILVWTFWIAILRSDFKGKLKDIWSHKINFFNKVFVYYLISYGLSFAVLIIGILIFPESNGQESANQQSLEVMIDSLNPMVMFLLIVVGAPLIEELVFRFAIIDKVFHFLRYRYSAIISAMLFATIHVIGSPVDDAWNFIYLILTYLPMSIVLVVIYIREKNIYYSIGVHMLNNLVAFIALVSLLEWM